MLHFVEGLTPERELRFISLFPSGNTLLGVGALWTDLHWMGLPVPWSFQSGKGCIWVSSSEDDVLARAISYTPPILGAVGWYGAVGLGVDGDGGILIPEPIPVPPVGVEDGGDGMLIPALVSPIPPIGVLRKEVFPDIVKKVVGCSERNALIDDLVRSSGVLSKDAMVDLSF